MPNLWLNKDWQFAALFASLLAMRWVTSWSSNMETRGVEYGRGLIWTLAKMRGIIPPFVLEVILIDGSHYYVHSVPIRDEETKSLVVRIWDLRAMTADDIADLKASLSKLRSRDELSDERKIHSRLDWGNLRIELKQIAYCIEWHDRLWPEAEKLELGFR